MTDKPSQALRQGRRVSSMWLAIEAVKRGEADCAVSAGNTGALMAMAKICLRMLPLIERPGASPRCGRRCAANRSCSTSARRSAPTPSTSSISRSWARRWRASCSTSRRPTVGLLNVGVEEIKGIEEVKAAGRLLREADLPNLGYHGFVEGDDLGKGTVDVVVTEGFTGNIALKTAEGTAKQIGRYMRDAMGASLLSRASAICLRARRLRRAAAQDGPGRVNGGVFLGLDGIVIKSHGGADADGLRRRDRGRLRHGAPGTCSPRSGT